MVESTGSDTYVYLSPAGGLTEPIVARLSGNVGLKQGDRMTVWFDLNRAHFFDRASSRRLTAGVS